MVNIADGILALALLEGPCPDEILADAMGSVFTRDGIHVELGYRPLLDMPHPACQGTGKVARYTVLRVPCDKRHFRTRTIGTSRTSRVPITCAEKGCRSWTPVSGDAAVVALLEAGRPWHIGLWSKGTGWQSGHRPPGRSNHILTKEYPTMLEALATALEAATEAQDVTP